MLLSITQSLRSGCAVLVKYGTEARIGIQFPWTNKRRGSRFVCVYLASMCIMCGNYSLLANQQHTDRWWLLVFYTCKFVFAESSTHTSAEWCLCKQFEIAKIWANSQYNTSRQDKTVHFMCYEISNCVWRHFRCSYENSLFALAVTVLGCPKSPIPDKSTLL